MTQWWTHHTILLHYTAFVWLSDIFFPETKIIDATLVPRNNITLAWFHRKWSGVWDEKTVLSRSTRPPVVLALQRICHCDACQRSWRITLRVHLLCTPHQFEKKSKKRQDNETNKSRLFSCTFLAYCLSVCNSLFLSVALSFCLAHHLSSCQSAQLFDILLTFWATFVLITKLIGLTKTYQSSYRYHLPT